ncbi:MAG: serine hydrolase [Bdellovibrionales bacterium]
MMRKIRLTALFFLIFMISLSANFSAEARTRRYAVDKYADIVIEADTGYILRSRNRNAQRYPASLTKMMTLYLVFQAIERGEISLETEFKVSSLAARQPASKLGLNAGERISVYDGIMSLITLSANDVAVVMAEGVGGSVQRFVSMMNRQALTLGMNHTQFKNPSGLPHRRQYTTAQDMAVLAQALIYHYPSFYPYFSKQEHDYDGRTLHGHNRLQAKYRGMDGIKTGYTDASGFNLTSSAVRNGTRLIGVVLGGTTAQRRDKQMATILDTSFQKVQRSSIQRVLAQGMPRYKNSEYITLASKNGAFHEQTRPSTKYLARPKNDPPKNEKTYIASPSIDSPNRPTPPQIVKQETQWGLQIGAFSEISGAERMLIETAQQSGRLLKDARQSLQKLTMTDGSTMYRARFLGIDQQTARDVCAHLLKKGQKCLVVSGT